MADRCSAKQASLEPGFQNLVISMDVFNEELLGLCIYGAIFLASYAMAFFAASSLMRAKLEA